jgi:hypothetical protein
MTRNVPGSAPVSGRSQQVHYGQAEKGHQQKARAVTDVSKTLVEESAVPSVCRRGTAYPPARPENDQTAAEPSCEDKSFFEGEGHPVHLSAAISPLLSEATSRGRVCVTRPEAAACAPMVETHSSRGAA